MIQKKTNFNWLHEIVRLLKSSKAYDVKNGTALDQCQQGAMSCQKPFKQIETIEIFFQTNENNQSQNQMCSEKFHPLLDPKFAAIEKFCQCEIISCECISPLGVTMI